MKTLLLILTITGVVGAQSAPPRKDIPAIAKAADGLIVSIITSGKDSKPVAQGTGFLVSTDGRIVTNYHVIKNASSAIVKLPDGGFYDVDGIVAFDKVRDLAVIKAHGQNFRVVTLGDSDRVQVGEEIVAIGSPLSLESTVSNGIVSGIRTVQEKGGRFLQITAPISPGSSGGPLFNMAGEVVGVTTLYLQGGENLNFAIPINDAKLLLSANSKVQDFPNEPAPEPVKAQTPEPMPKVQASGDPTPDAIEALKWIQANMTRETFASPLCTRCEITTHMVIQGCRATIYEETQLFTSLPSLIQIQDTWGPFELSDLRSDAMGATYRHTGMFPNDNVLGILALSPIPLVHTISTHDAFSVLQPSTINTMMNGLQIQFDSAATVTRQAKAWHDAIVGCGGKPIPDVY